MAEATARLTQMTIEAELLAIEGVTDVIVAIGESGPIGIQVEVAPASDRKALVQTIARVLDSRGLSAAFPAEPVRDRGGSPHESAPSTGSHPSPPSARPSQKGHGPPGRVTADRGVGTVAVSENSLGVRIAVRLSDGVRGSTQSPAAEPVIWQSLAELLYELADLSGPRPVVEAVEWLVVGGVESVVVVVSAGEHRLLGAAAATATRPLAVARALWAALT